MNNEIDLLDPKFQLTEGDISLLENNDISDIISSYNVMMQNNKPDLAKAYQRIVDMVKSVTEIYIAENVSMHINVGSTPLGVNLPVLGKIGLKSISFNIRI